MPLQIEDDFLADFGAAAFFAKFLNRFGAEAVILFDDGMNGAGSGQDDPKTFAQQEPQVALLHRARRLAEGQRQQSSSMPTGRKW